MKGSDNGKYTYEGLAVEDCLVDEEGHHSVRMNTRVNGDKTMHADSKEWVIEAIENENGDNATEVESATHTQPIYKCTSESDDESKRAAVVADSARLVVDKDKEEEEEDTQWEAEQAMMAAYSIKVGRERKTTAVTSATTATTATIATTATTATVTKLHRRPYGHKGIWNAEVANGSYSSNGSTSQENNSQIACLVAANTTTTMCTSCCPLDLLMVF